jgi:hypothetical protein
VLPVAVLVAFVLQVCFLLLVLDGAPVWTWYVSFALGEAFVPNTGSLIRARWAFVLDEPAEVRTTFALESVLDEVVFALGPLVAALLAVAWRSWGAIAVSSALLAIGTLWLVPQRATEPPAAGLEHRDGTAAVRYSGVLLVVVVFVLAGGVFGSAEVSITAFAAQHGVRAWTGVLLACYSLGSGIAGLVLGTLRPRLSLRTSSGWRSGRWRSWRCRSVRRYARGAAVLALLAGLAVGPSLITGRALIEQLVPAARLTEGLTVAISGLTVGLALGTACSGPLIDARGASAGFVVIVSCGAAGSALAVLGTPHLDRATRALTGLASSETSPRRPD